MRNDAAISGRWPLRFVLGSLVALAIVPTVIGRRIAADEQYVWQVLDPAASLNTEIILLHSQQRAGFEWYLVRGDASRRDEYTELRDRERELLADLDSLVKDADPALRGHVAALQLAAVQWHLGHELVLQGDLTRADYRLSALDDQTRFDALLEAATSLTVALGEAMDRGVAEMRRNRDLQLLLTAVLAALALLATAAAGLVGVRLESLVTEAEEQRREAFGARRETQATLEATGDGVLGLDLGGRCTMLNATGARLLGVSEADARDLNVHDLLHARAPEGEGHDRRMCPINEAIRSGVREQEREDVFWRRDGSSFLGKWHFRPLQGGILGGVLTLTDMTEIRTVQKSLEQAVHDRDNVVAVVSHDLRNPLGTIVGASELLLELDLAEHQRSEQLRIISRASRRMSRLIEDLLDVSRIEAGGLTIDPRPIPIEPVLQEAVELHLPLATEKGVQLGSELEAALPPLMADDERVLQVLSNLVANAIKHTPAGGRVTVGVHTSSREIVLSVTDTGEGIAPEDLDRLFDRFWQGRMRGRSGVGLGLAIVKGIVEAHGGRVWVESVLGDGSGFYFTLPVAPEASSGASHRGLPEAPARAGWPESTRTGA